MAHVGQPGGHGGEVGGLALAVQHQGGAVDLAVGAQVEGLRVQHLGHPTDGVGIEQDAAQHRLFGLQVLGRHGIGQGLEAGFGVARPTPPFRLGPLESCQRHAHHRRISCRRSEQKPPDYQRPGGGKDATLALPQ